MPAVAVVDGVPDSSTPTTVLLPVLGPEGWVGVLVGVLEEEGATDCDVLPPEATLESEPPQAARMRVQLASAASIRKTDKGTW